MLFQLLYKCISTTVYKSTIYVFVKYVRILELRTRYIERSKINSKLKFTCLLLNVISCKNLENQVFLLPKIMYFRKKNNHYFTFFLNVNIILELKRFKGMLCNVIEIKKGFQRDYKLLQYFTLMVYTVKQLKKMEKITLAYFGRLNFVKF